MSDQEKIKALEELGEALGILPPEQAAPEQTFHPKKLPAECCLKCRHFGTMGPDGRMHGASPLHRKCRRPRTSDGPDPWRHPTDWCDKFYAKEQP